MGYHTLPRQIKKSQLNLTNQRLIYKVVIKCVYGFIVIMGHKKSNIEIVQDFQSKTIRSIVDSPWVCFQQHYASRLKTSYCKRRNSMPQQHLHIKIGLLS